MMVRSLVFACVSTEAAALVGRAAGGRAERRVVRALAWIVFCAVLPSALASPGGSILLSPDTDPAQPERVTPRLLDPEDGALLEGPVTYPPDGVSWTFTWSRVPDANAYQLLVRAPHLAEPFYDEVLEDVASDPRCSVSTGSCFGVVSAGTEPLRTGAERGWTWQVRPRLGSVWGPWSVVGRFDVEPSVDTAGTETRLEGRLEGWTSGAVRIAALAHPAWPVVAEGSVRADGSFVIDLPALVLSRAAFAFDAGPDAALSVSAPVRILIVPWFFLSDDADEVGYAALATSLEAADVWWSGVAPPGQVLATWWFADRDARLQGQLDAYAFDVDLRRGWNVVLVRAPLASGETGGAPEQRPNEVVSAVSLPSDVSWHWRRYGDAEEPNR